MTKWSDEDIQYIRVNYGVISASQIGRDLGRTQGSIVGQADRLGLISNLKSNGGPGHGVERSRLSKSRPASSIPAGRKGPASPSKMGLAVTSVDERMGGAGMFKTVAIREVLIDVPGYQCVGVPDIVALKPHQCCWPLDAGGFCGNDRYRGSHHKETSYCLTHMRESINPRHYRGGYWATHG